MQQKKLSIFILITSILILNQAQAVLPQALIKKYSSAEIKENQIVLRVPEIAEEGSVVPIRIRSITLPDKDTYVTEVSFYSESNTHCPLSRYQLTPNMLSEGLGTNVKLPHSSNIHVIAKLSNGDVISGSKEVKVTIGGCGGGGPMPSGASAGNYCLKKNTSIQ